MRSDFMMRRDLDPEDAERWKELALLLGDLRTPVERARFATLYQHEATDSDAGADLAALLETAAVLWAREGDNALSRKLAHVA